jgi:predicted ATPase
MSVPFVGRRAEMDALEGAVRGAHRLVVVTGDAGVGKTRLVAEAARASVDRGSLVVETSCLPLDVKLPLLPFIEAQPLARFRFPPDRCSKPAAHRPKARFGTAQPRTTNVAFA